MNVLLNEPYYTGSHKYWADNLVKYSSHDIQLMTMKGKHWKWRLQGSAVYLADKLVSDQLIPDLIICSSMMDVSVYKALAQAHLKECVPIIYYMHENQLTYPYSHNESRKEENFNYGFINYKSCLAADFIVFNSHYHKNNFFSALLKLLERLPDYSLKKTIAPLLAKSAVIPVGIDIDFINQHLTKVKRKPKLEEKPPTLLWNNRWDTDKNPELFFELCEFLHFHNLEFKLILTGEVGNCSTTIYQAFKDKFQSNIVHAGYVDLYTNYIELLSQATILPVTSDHDFYGISVMEGILAGAYPILPRSKVYEEYIFHDEFPDVYYEGKNELFDKVKMRLNKNKVDKIKNALLSQCIHNVLETYDLYIEEKYYVFQSQK